MRVDAVMARSREATEFSLTKQMIQELCGAAAYMRGEAYLRSGQVISVKREVSGAGYKALVKGNQQNRYQVEIEVDEGGEVGASCECVAYSPLSYCKHIAAVLLTLVDERAEETFEPVEVISEKDTHLTNQVIFLFDRALSKQPSEMNPSETPYEDTVPLDVEYSCKLVKSFSN
jgi:uncharacterized Zn finger protein